MMLIVKHLIRYFVEENDMVNVRVKVELEEMNGSTIETILGEMIYSHTEIEDENGNWNDHWSTENGEYVIHGSKRHHVYVLR